MSETTCIRFAVRPVVKVISAPTIHESNLAECVGALPQSITHSHAGDALSEAAGRVCYDSFAAPRPGGNHAYLTHIKECGHGSTLEHANYTLFIGDISRPCAQQLTRHRAGFAYSMRSQRYVDETGGAVVIPPEYLAPDAHEEHAAFVDVCANQWATYRALVELTTARVEREVCRAHNIEYKWRGVDFLSREQRTEIRKRARQAARGALPLNMATALFVTGNARAWRHFIEQRGSEHADLEIRGLAVRVLLTLRNHAPALFADYEIRGTPKPNANGACYPVDCPFAPGTIHTRYAKV